MFIISICVLISRESELLRAPWRARFRDLHDGNRSSIAPPFIEVDIFFPVNAPIYKCSTAKDAGCVPFAGRFVYDIFLVATPARNRTGRLSRTRERDGRRRNSLFCANTSREAHAESHTNINRTYTAGLTKLFRRKRRMRRAASACRLSRLRAETAFDEEALRNAISPWTGVPMLSNKTASSDATFQKWRFPHLHSPRRVSFSVGIRIS